jgi:hypothetical protein
VTAYSFTKGRILACIATPWRSGERTAEFAAIRKLSPYYVTNAYRTTLDVEEKSGKKHHQQVDRIYDGKERPMPINGHLHKGTEIAEFTEGGGRKITMKEDGKVVETLVSSVSKDGKTMTNRETTDKGETVFVMEKE